MSSSRAALAALVSASLLFMRAMASRCLAVVVSSSLMSFWTASLLQPPNYRAISTSYSDLLILFGTAISSPSPSWDSTVHGSQACAPKHFSSGLSD